MLENIDLVLLLPLQRLPKRSAFKSKLYKVNSSKMLFYASKILPRYCLRNPESNNFLKQKTHKNRIKSALNKNKMPFGKCFEQKIRCRGGH
jgi:hypothetical protein